MNETPIVGPPIEPPVEPPVGPPGESPVESVVPIGPKILDPQKRSFWNIMGESLVVAGLAVSISLASYIVVQQYHAWRQRQLTGEIQPSTSWIQKSSSLFIVHYKDLWKIGLDGSEAMKLFEGSDVLRECILSPDGRSVVVRVADELYWVGADGKAQQRIEGLDLPKDVRGVRGSFSEIVWARDSQKFFYKVSRWSMVASVENVRLFDVAKRTVEDITNSGDPLPELVWDWEGKNLYFVRTFEGAFSFMHIVHLYRIPLDTKKIEAVTEFDSRETKFSRMDWESQNVKLYFPSESPSFKKLFTLRTTAVSTNGKKAGLDKNNFVYLIDVLGRPKRLLELPWASPAEFTALDGMDWAPGDRYLLLFHRSQGLLVFDTLKRRVGRLIDLRPQAIAWGPG